jgi:hypothetical protein
MDLYPRSNTIKYKIYHIATLLYFSTILLALSIFGNLAFAEKEIDFVQTYKQARLYLQQKLYPDAINALTDAMTKTKQGKTHFGTHYYLAMAYFWLPEIEKTMEFLQQAEKLAKTPAHRQAVKQLKTQISSLYGILQLIPEIDPDEIGKLNIQLQPKAAFQNQHKQLYFSVLSHKLQQRGGIQLDGNSLFLPKGDYQISIARDQCLQLSLMLDKKHVQEITISEQPLSLQVKARRSCDCLGNQQIYGEGRDIYCSCPVGMGWNNQNKRCEFVEFTKECPVGSVWNRQLARCEISTQSCPKGTEWNPHSRKCEQFRQINPRPTL